MKRYLAFAAVLFALSGSADAQRPAETVPKVSELDSFHEVIYKIWHEAWPNKNTAMLRQLLPEVEKGISEVASAQLPGILRDKKAVWEEGVKKLQSAGADYKAAATAKDDARLMDAAEALHSRFEGLVRAIRPALKELDEFHAVLYMLYHHYLPKNDRENILKSAAELQEKMTALNKAALPARLKDRDADFQARRGQLSQSVAALQTQVRSSNDKAIKEAIETVHSNYQALEKVF